MEQPVIKTSEHKKLADFINDVAESPVNKLASQGYLKLEDCTVEISKIALLKDGLQWPVLLFTLQDMRKI